MGCLASKQRRQIKFDDPISHQQNTIKIQRNQLNNSYPQIILKKNQKQWQQEKQIHDILNTVEDQITSRNTQDILKDIVKMSQQCIEYYKQHNLDFAYAKLHQLQKDIKELQLKGYKVSMNEHFKQEFIELSHILTSQYHDMINFNKQILSSGWKVQKDKKNFKVSSRMQGDTVGILLQSILEVPFQNFIAVMIQPDLYKQFLPFIKISRQEKNVSRNSKVAFVQMDIPLISNRQSFFQGVLYDRLNNSNLQDQQLFMYTRSIHNRPDIQKRINYQVKTNPKNVQFQYKYLVVKYVPLSENAGKMTLGLNIDLKLNFLPMKLLQMVSISFSKDFYDNIVRISQNFKGSKWQQGLQKDRELFDFTKKVKDNYLRKYQR